MPFREILIGLLQATQGSLGAMFLDWEGESVEVTTERPFDADDHDLKVIGAYQGIFLTRLKKLCSDIGVGDPQRFKMEFARTKVLSCDLRDGYYLVLVIETGANEGAAWHQLASCREKLLAEM